MIRESMLPKFRQSSEPNSNICGRANVLGRDLTDQLGRLYIDLAKTAGNKKGKD